VRMINRGVSSRVPTMMIVSRAREHQRSRSGDGDV